MKFVGIIVVTAALSACGAFKPKYTYDVLNPGGRASADERTVSHPPAGETSTVEIGVSMVSTSKVSTIEAIEVKKDVRHVTRYSDSQKMALGISKGVFRLAATDSRGKYFESGPLSLYYESKKNGDFDYDSPVPGGVYVRNDGARFVYWRWEGHPLYAAEAPLIEFSPTVYSLGERGASFKRELVYSGISQSTVGILYREFINDMARPSFSQELRYDLSQSKIIGYRGARFEVLKADNTGITYRVIAPLEGQ